MYYVYVLKSVKNGDFYIGYSSNIKKRVKQHNSRKVKSTKTNTPWKLVYYEPYSDKIGAIRRERSLKMNHKAKQDLLSQIRSK
ncbi:MAG: GIY-YIG nuclease family protein [Nanoarchaeota archaeon]